MSYLIICSDDIKPCAPSSQALVSEPSLDDLAQIGLTPTSCGLAIGFGLSVVLVFGLLGLSVRWAIQTIRAI